jgi:hypothetical protein
MRALSIVVAGALALLVLSGCGGSGRAIDPQASHVLAAQVASARAAVADGQPARAAQLLQAVDDTVASLRQDHLISDRKAADVLAALGDTEDALHHWTATSTTTSTTTTTAPPPAPKGDKGHHGNRGNGHGDEDG